VVNNLKFGTAVPSDFTVSIAGGPGPVSAAEDGPVIIGLAPGISYNVSANGPAGYDLARSGDCVGTSTVGRRSCTLTLTEQPMMCDDSLWSRVYLRDRLHVLDACEAASGIVADAGIEMDGDLVIELVPDAPYTNLLRPGNRTNPSAHGNLVVEVPCQGSTNESAPTAACASFTGARIAPPPRGAHIVAAAHWVEDRNHSAWGELHGANIRLLPR
jgi:hypothetical protein